MKQQILPPLAAVQIYTKRYPNIWDKTERLLERAKENPPIEWDRSICMCPINAANTIALTCTDSCYDPKKKTIIVYVPKATGIALPDYGIEGLNELRAAIEENNAYQESFHQMMANEDNDGIYPPKTLQYSVAELMRKYPSAAAYLEAEEYSESENYAQSTIGERP